MRQCKACDVMWRGLAASACWSCGGPGESAWLLPFGLCNQLPDRVVRGEGIEPPTSAV